jgi:hypothetical protein
MFWNIILPRVLNHMSPAQAKDNGYFSQTPEPAPQRYFIADNGMRHFDANQIVS